MPRPLEKGGVRRPVVNGEVDVDRGDPQPRHQARFVRAKNGVVIEFAVRAFARPGGNVRVGFVHGPRTQGRIVRMGLFDLLGGRRVGQVDLPLVIVDDLRLIELRDPAGRLRIEENAEAEHSDERGNQRGRRELPLAFSPAIAA